MIDLGKASRVATDMLQPERFICLPEAQQPEAATHRTISGATALSVAAGLFSSTSSRNVPARVGAS